MVSPDNNTNQNNMAVSPIPTNPDNLLSYRERNNRNGIYNRRHDNIMIPNPNVNNIAVDLNLLLYTTTETGQVDHIWDFEEQNVVLPQNGPLRIHLR